ncbi:MAG: choice-of-anchor B family protein [Chitinophagales bacterium]
MKKYILSLLQFACVCFIVGTLFLPVFAQIQMDSLSNLFYPDGLNDVWGYVDESGNEYALVGVKTGVSIVNVTNPVEPQELFFIEGESSIWRDLKTYEHYLYVVNETKGGMQIIDLQNLPMSIDTSVYIEDSSLNTAHNIYIDERGLAYLSGYNNFKKTIPTAQRGVKILDLKPNPLAPTFLYDFTHQYSHDAYVRNGILLSSEVYVGQLMIADVSDPMNPVVLATHSTPNDFTHNAWFSDNGQVVFTTDEKNDAYIASYDISDLSDIRELDRYQSSPGENVMPHNVHVFNDFLVISYYNDGVIIVDAHEPDALVETEYFDTSLHSGMGALGCWGAYPFLPSGNILATDREQGLFVLRPTYQRAAYVEGNVTNKETGEVVEGVEIKIEGKEGMEISDFGGHFKTGVAQAGTYTFSFYKYGYEPLTIENVNLETAKIMLLNVELQARTSFELTVEIVDKATGKPIEGVQFEAKIPAINYAQLSNESGNISISSFYADKYLILAYKWGLVTWIKDIVVNESNTHLRLELQREYEDDFWLNFGWSVSVAGDMTGVWKRDVPKGTFLEDGSACNPDKDVQDDFSNFCFVTGSSGGELEDNDLDGGTTTLFSPIFDLTDFNLPILSFYQWFCSSDVSDNEADFVKFELKNGIDTVDLQTIYTDYETQNVWHQQSFNVLEYLPATQNMQLIITAKGSSADLVVEAAIDVFRIMDANPTDIEEPISNNRFNLQIIPNPFENQTIFQFENVPATTNPILLQIFDSMGRMVLQRRFLQHELIGFNWGESAESGLYIVKFGGETRKVLKY